MYVFAELRDQMARGEGGFFRRLWATIRYLFRRIRFDLKAWKRGEVRVAPGLRGRVYARKRDLDPRRDRPSFLVPPERLQVLGPQQPGGAVKTRAKATATMKLRVIRKDGTIEEIPGEFPADVRTLPPDFEA